MIKKDHNQRQTMAPRGSPTQYLQYLQSHDSKNTIKVKQPVN